jgi:transposase
MNAITIGLDIAKSSFQVHGVDAAGKVVLRKQLRRGKLLELFANLPCCRVGIEACGGAHHWARELTKLGHEVRLMPPQYVKPYVKTNKHDAADAEGCCEAVQRPSMRFVPVKNEMQQALLMLHRIRDRLIAERTGTINAIRGHMAEFGVVAARRGLGMQELLAIISDVDDARLPSLARELLVLQVEHLRVIETRLGELDGRVLRQARDDEAARRLTEIPGIGPVIATAMVATVVDARLFASGRSFAALRRCRCSADPCGTGSMPPASMARPHPAPARDRRPGAAARHQQARRRLSAATAHARRPVFGPGRGRP